MTERVLTGVGLLSVLWIGCALYSFHLDPMSWLEAPGEEQSLARWMVGYSAEIWDVIQYKSLKLFCLSWVAFAVELAFTAFIIALGVLFFHISYTKHWKRLGKTVLGTTMIHNRPWSVPEPRSLRYLCRFCTQFSFIHSRPCSLLSIRYMKHWNW